jgi:hypothetical protein
LSPRSPMIRRMSGNPGRRRSRYHRDRSGVAPCSRRSFWLQSLTVALIEPKWLPE